MATAATGPRIDAYGIQRYPLSGVHHPAWIYWSLAGRRTTFDRILPDGRRFVWNNPFVTVQDTVETGFFALGVGDKVECAFCRLQTFVFEDGDVPALEHTRRNPSCPFLSGLMKNTEDRPPCKCSLCKSNTQQIQPKSNTTSGKNEYVRLEGMSDKDYIKYLQSCVQGCNKRINGFLHARQRWIARVSDLEREVSRLRNSSECQFCLSGSNQQLRARNSALKSKINDLTGLNKCKICFEDKACVLIIPCGHIVGCEPCTNRILDCAVCRVKITGRINAFL